MQGLPATGRPVRITQALDDAIHQMRRLQQAPEASGKGDMLVVNREGKGSLLSPPVKTVEAGN